MAEVHSEHCSMWTNMKKPSIYDEPPQLLYKYRGISAQDIEKNNPQGWTRKLLTLGEMYFAHITELNDPEEHLYFYDEDIGANLTDEELAKYPIKKLSERKRDQNLCIISGETQGRRENESLRKDKNRGIFCVSDNCLSKRMFDEYANNGTGICVGLDWKLINLCFDGSSPPKRLEPRRVIYTLSIPVIKKGRHIPEQMLEALCTKRDKYSFEEEWRFFHKKGSSHQRLAIKQIVFGYAMPENSEQEKIVRGWLANREDVQFFRTGLNENSKVVLVQCD